MKRNIEKQFQKGFAKKKVMKKNFKDKILKQK